MRDLWTNERGAQRHAWEAEARRWGFCETTIREATDRELARQVLELARVSTLWGNEPQSCPVPSRA